MSDSKALAIACALVASTALVSCSQQSSSSHDTATTASMSSEQPSSSTPATTGQTRAPQESTIPESSTIGTTTSTAPDPAACNAQKTNPLLGTDHLSVAGGRGETITFSVSEDHFDPCAPLSWSVIAGGVGSGNSLREGVVFFIDGEPVNSPMPLMEEKVLSVTPLGDASARVTYSILTGPRAAEETVQGSATFTADPAGGLAISDNSLPAVANEAGIQVDVSTL
ncbi:LppP/LprE family lipoprotein [Corynebacterium flavescens]|uniref:LppP/LprE family lipoprotein n=1 Tax=Corynebacterium flavescens TaxID=28028 RepID=UPI003FD2EE6C